VLGKKSDPEWTGAKSTSQLGHDTDEYNDKNSTCYRYLIVGIQHYITDFCGGEFYSQNCKFMCNLILKTQSYQIESKEHTTDTRKQEHDPENCPESDPQRFQLEFPVAHVRQLSGKYLKVFIG